MPPEQSGQFPREQAQSATDASTLLPSFKGFHVSIRRSHRMTNSINTVDIASRYGGPPTPIDIGFIVHNKANYPNLCALFDHVGVLTRSSNMSFSVSLDGGRVEYAGTSPFAL